jgi:hypothetical protein
MLFFMLNCQITVKKRNLSIDNEEVGKQKDDHLLEKENPCQRSRGS